MKIDMNEMVEKMVEENLVNAETITWKELKKKYKLSKAEVEELNPFFMTTELNWYGIAINYNVSEQFLRQHVLKMKKYCFAVALMRNNFSFDFVREFADQFNEQDWQMIDSNINFHKQFVKNEKLLKTYCKEFGRDEANVRKIAAELKANNYR